MYVKATYTVRLWCVVFSSSVNMTLLQHCLWQSTYGMCYTACGNLRTVCATLLVAIYVRYVLHCLWQSTYDMCYTACGNPRTVCYYTKLPFAFRNAFLHLHVSRCLPCKHVVPKRHFGLRKQIFLCTDWTVNKKRVRVYFLSIQRV